MNDKDLNHNNLIDHVNEQPPSEDKIYHADTLGKPIRYIAWGFIITTLHLNFLYLNYILPTIGVLLIFFGFRSLKIENKYFMVGWKFSIINLFLHLCYIVKISTPFNNMDYSEFIVGLVMMVFQITMLLIFRAALKDVYKKIDKVSERDPLLFASLWTVVAFLIAVSPFANSWLVFIIMAVWYIVIFRSLYCIADELDDSEYVLTYMSVRIGNKILGWGYFLILLTIVISCCVFYNHLKLNSQIYQIPKITESRQHLINMGFPAKALQYLSDEDVFLISGTVRVKALSEMLMFDAREVRHENRESYDSNTSITYTHKPGEKNIEATTVYIEMPENVVYVLQYFAWKGGQPVWQDAVQISGESQAKNWKIISSGLFYQKDNVSYRADFPRLVCGNIKQNGMFGPSNYEQILGSFSYPFGSERQGGYVLYSYTLLNDSNTYCTASVFNYVHLSTPFYIPYENTEYRILNGTLSFSDDMQQHYTNYDSLEYTKIRNAK